MVKNIKNGVRTAEFVSPMHPDKICDFIADSLLDKYLALDPKSRVAIEVMGGHNLITINGEVSSQNSFNIENEVLTILNRLNIDTLDFKIIYNIDIQSSQIARSVDIGGAGDQGIMLGYATNQTENFMPLEYELARDLCKSIFEIYPYDAKTQVTIDGNKVLVVLASFQNSKNENLLKLVKEKIEIWSQNGLDITNVKYLVNPSGEWDLGNFDADTGLSGRKLIIDNYGPEVRIGGGSFSGKDYTKVDRSGAYISRKIALDLLKKYSAEEVIVKIAYAIGIKDPVMKIAIIDGKETEIEDYDLSPKGIYEKLELNKIKFSETANWGHFGRNFSWDK
jgi:S-adenosylmethionine synthetase